MLYGRKRTSSKSFYHFPIFFSVHYSLAIEYKPLGKYPIWLVKLGQKIAGNEWEFAGLGSWSFWKNNQSLETFT